MKWLNKISVLVAALAFTPVLAGTASAYGPERTTYKMNEPADVVTFNSITDNPALGDERNFVRVMEVGADKYADEVQVKPGKEYEVYIYYHNNAKSTLNQSGKGIARGVKVQTNFPTTVLPGKKETIKGRISATNATPQEVWDEAFMTSVEKVTLRYKVGSATILNSTKTNGRVLSTNLFSATGTYIGSNDLDGLLPGCAEWSGRIVYRLVAEASGATLDKKVSTDGNNFAEKVTVKSGDVVTYKIEFKNTGNVDLTNVTFSDIFPAGLTLVPDSVKLVNAAHKNGIKLDNNALLGQGYNTGLYGAGATATVTYQAKVAEDYCSDDLLNKAKVGYDGGELSDGAAVHIDGCGNTTVTVNEMPETGPAEIVLATMVALGLGVGGYYLIRSQLDLKN